MGIFSTLPAFLLTGHVDSTIHFNPACENISIRLKAEKQNHQKVMNILKSLYKM